MGAFHCALEDVSLPGLRALRPAGLKAERLVLLAEFRHREDVGAPELVILTPVDGGENLLFGAAVFVEHEPGGLLPLGGDDGPLGAVGFDAVGEVCAESLDVGSRRNFRHVFNLCL